MEIASAGMATYGNEFEQIIGLVTAGTEIMTGRSSQVARGLNTIASRIVKNQGALEDYGIQVEDVNGNLKSTYDVLSELKPKWDSMSEAERVALGDSIAGTNQYKVLAAVMQNFEHATDAATTALNSSGSAIKENAAYMESLEAKTTAVKATFQDLANNVIDDELVGSVLDLANGFLQLANTDLGRIVTQITLLTGVGWGATGLLQASKIIPSVISQFKNFGAAASLAASGASGFFQALSVGGGVLTGILPVILAVATALAVGGALWKATEDSRKSIGELNDTIDTDSQKLQTNKERLAEINGMAWNDKTPEILAEKDALEKENEQLEAQIEKYQQLKTEKAQAILDNAYTTETTYETRRVRGQETVVPVTELKKGAEYYELLTQKLQKYQTILQQNKSLTNEQVVEYNNLTSEAGRLASAMENVEGGVASCTNEQQLMYNTLQSTQVAYNDAQTYISNYVNKLLEQAEKTGVAKNELYNLAAQMVATNNQQLNFSQQIAALQQLATQAGYSASAIAAVMGMSDTGVQNQIRASATGLMQQAHYAGKKLSSEDAMRQASQAYMKNLWGSLTTFHQPSASTTTPSGGTSVPTYTSPSSSKQTQKNKEEAKDAVKEVEKTAEDAVDNVSDSVSDALNEQKQVMQGVIDYYVEYASRKIEELQDQIDAINDKYDQMLQDAEDRAQAQLDALEAQNDAVEDQITLQQKLNALDKAKNTMQMVFKDGQFVYQADADEVSKSQNELNAYYRQKDYENRKKYIEDSLKAEKDYIETLRKNETAALEEEKDRWEEYKEGWSNLTSEYEYQQNKLLADQMFGADQENATWQTRLANLQSFVSQYNSLMGSLSGFGGGGASGGAGGVAGGVWGTGNDNLNAWDLNSAYNSIWNKDEDYDTLLEDAIKKGYGIDWISGVAGQRNAKLRALGLEGQVESTQDLFDRLVKQYGYNQGYTGEYGTFQGGSGYGTDTPSNRPSASSPVSASDQSAIMRLEDQIANNSAAWFNASPAERERLHAENERLRKELERLNPNGYASGTMSARGGISMVGEQGPELRVLNQGDGIIPADITRNLMKIGSDPHWFASRSGAGNTILNVANVSLPSVRNAQQFVDGLKQMAIQRSYAAT
nr:MAG TPA: tail tape measure protein [Caudoviricetes sp.]